VAALERAEAADQVLDRAPGDVVDAGPAVGGGRALEEHEGRAALGALQRALEQPLLLPARQELLLQRVGGEIGPGRERHRAGVLRGAVGSGESNQPETKGLASAP
jgi:hypothetical protein